MLIVCRVLPQNKILKKSLIYLQLFNRSFKARKIFHILKRKLLILSLPWQCQCQGIVFLQFNFLFFCGLQNVELIWSQLLQDNANKMVPRTEVNFLFTSFRGSLKDSSLFIGFSSWMLPYCQILVIFQF